jgi:hypothetical protein
MRGESLPEVNHANTGAEGPVFADRNGELYLRVCVYDD